MFLIAITPFFGIYYRKSQAYRFGQKPEKVTNFGRLTKRQVLQLDHVTEPKNAILEARRYQACLEDVPDRTRAEVAEMFSISRARVTQYLNLLKLPPVIVGFLETNEDPAILGYFTERRLRPLTRLADDQETWDQFEEMLAK